MTFRFWVLIVRKTGGFKALVRLLGGDEASARNDAQQLDDQQGGVERMWAGRNRWAITLFDQISEYDVYQRRIQE